jgi:hypothetical protein
MRAVHPLKLRVYRQNADLPLAARVASAAILASAHAPGLPPGIGFLCGTRKQQMRYDLADMDSETPRK